MAIVPGSVHDAALRCMARWGIDKTTLDDVAREASVSRASVYRAAPGGKDALVATVVAREAADALHAIRHAIDAADDLEDALVGASLEAGRRLSTHPVLRFLARYEPHTVLPYVSFDGLERLLRTLQDELAPSLERWLDAPAARRAVDWAARVVLSYACSPHPAVDLASEASVRDLVSRFVSPAVRGAAAAV